MNHKNKALLNIAIRASIEAGNEILKIYHQNDFGIQKKLDDSPITLADKNANAVINTYLQATQIPIISEENKIMDYETRKQWNRCWIVDPLDGTKEFIKRNGEFTVNIALVENNLPIMGVIYVPVSGDLYFGLTSEKKAYKINTVTFSEDLLGKAEELNGAVGASTVKKVIGSRSHFSSATKKYIEEIRQSGEEVVFVSVGSSLKFCFLAEGKASIYPRFSPTMEWDTCAGDAICSAVGLKVIDAETKKRLVYNKKELVNPSFIVN